MPTISHSFWWLLGRSLMPSGASLAGCILTSLAALGINILFLTLNAGELLPDMLSNLDATWVSFYSTFVANPLKDVLANPILNTIAVGLMWGLLGWLVYAGLEFVVTTLREFRESDDEVSLQGDNHVVRHPMRGLLVTRLLWRLGLGIGVIIMTIALGPVWAFLFDGEALLRTTSAADTITYIAIFTGVMTAILHGYVVLLRLFVFRTRLFGEIIY